MSTMNVELPDGTIIEDVPEGTTESELMRRVNLMRSSSKKTPTPLTPDNTNISMADTLAKISQQVFTPRTDVGSLPAGLVYGATDIARIPLKGVAKVYDWMEGIDPQAKGKGQAIRDFLTQADAARDEARKAEGNEGVDWPRVAGSIPVGTSIANRVASALPTAMSNIRKGMTSGAAVGAATPTPGGESEFSVDKLSGIGSSALLGGAVPLGGKALDLARSGSNKIEQYFTKEGFKPLAVEHIKKNIGAEHVQEVRDALLNAKSRLPANAPASGAAGPTLPESPMTAAEAVAHLSAGSPVAAMQKIVYETPGGPSKVGGDIWREAEAAQNAAKAARDAELLPRMNEILERADAAGKVVPKLERIAEKGERAAKVAMPKDVPSDALKTAVETHAPYTPPVVPSQGEIAKQAMKEAVQTRGQQAKQAMDMLKAEGMQPLRVNTVMTRINEVGKEEGIRASKVAQKTLQDVRQRLQDNSDLKGNINGQDLWTIRKEIGAIIQKSAGEEKNFDKRLSAKLLIGIQNRIDDAIEAAGGRGWKEVMREYSQRSANIEADIASKEGMYKPLQETVIQRGTNVAKGAIPYEGGPPFLMRAWTAAKWLPRARAEVIEPRVDAYMAELSKHAPALGRALQDQPPSRYQQIIEALMRSPTVIGAASTAGARQ